jgi:hypothetical protein
MMRRHHRNEDRLTGLETPVGGPLSQFLAPYQVAMPAGVIALMRFIRRINGVARRELRHRLAALQLQQDVVFGIEMVRRDRVGRRHEDEALRHQHRAGLRLDERLQFSPEIEQQRTIFGRPAQCS